MQLLCSTGAFGRYPVLIDHHDIVLYGPTLPVDGLEVMYYPEWGTRLREIARDLLATGLLFPALHVEKNAGPAMLSTDPDEQAQGRSWLDASCQLAELLGARVAVFHLWGMPDSDEQIERNLAILPVCLEIAQAHGLELAIETIPCKRSTPLEVLRRVLDVDNRCVVALDTEFLAIHGQMDEALDADWLWQDGRVRHIHVKDYDGQQYDANNYRRYLHPGEGNLDFARLFARLRERHFAGNLSLEASVVSPDLSRDLAKLQHTLQRLRLALSQ
jgi:sugar phosphate isomerase/epimerase